MLTEPSSPSVFISYSHDSEEHKEWVRTLAERLTRNGVHVVLDQWHLSLGDDLPLFMEQSVASCNYILLICTEEYVEKADMRAGGVGFESRLLASLLLTSSQIESKEASRLLPVVRQTVQMRRLPRFIGSRLYADFSVNASGVEAAYEKLVRTLHGTPKHEPPPLGSNPFARPAQERLTPGPLDLIEERGRVNPAPQQDGDEEPPRGRRIAWAAGISLALISIMLWLADDSGAFWREVVSADVAKVPSDPGVATKSQANAVTQTLASPGKANHTEPVATNKPVRLTSRTPRSGPAAATRNVELTLKFSADGWTEVYDAPGHRLFYDIGQAGSVHTVTGLLPIRLVLGNAAGVAIEVNGQPTEFSDLFRRDGTAHFLIDLNGRAAPSSKDSNSDY